MTELPSALHQLVSSVTDTYTVLAEHPRPGHARASVWEIGGPHRERWYAKQHAGALPHRREVDAYRAWTTCLGTGRAPELVTYDTQTHTILLTAVPGRSLDAQRLTAEQERKAYEQAGVLLGRLHASTVDEPVTQVTEERWEADAQALLERAARHVPQEVAAVCAFIEEAPPSLLRVATHGDYMPRNWLWDETEQRLRIIDFEQAELQTAARRDFSRLRYRVLFNRPDLDDAFHYGYGRRPTQEELAACRSYASVDALDALCWGIKHHDFGLVDEAHLMLDNLRRENATRAWGGRVS
ncbi:aminoglycoside phosphotransferase family protein [Streptomyces griseiscabiei]|uniref:Aminoglycoside phosphotransferase family protein n=1 Tax=Streptomyces griseiscabiei TaxID=2993540 RepID=A0ABU4KYU4_9ACTN|nr:aminoglycoside phosphotransferase family protein [Streptomyces griseiscabiei]MBZ3904516.1 aminoglycoside phosphotransferase family protein [Streptomyces griseiscabiei]MDX2908265.1 aminoglycoside phosphotransferase family protein [Streptomyces griseiscabiei]